MGTVSHIAGRGSFGGVPVGVGGMVRHGIILPPSQMAFTYNKASKHSIITVG